MNTVPDNLENTAVDLLELEPVKFFPELNYLFFGYFDPINLFFDNKNN